MVIILIWIILILSVVFIGCLLWIIRHYFISGPEMGENNGITSFILCALECILGQDATLEVHTSVLRYVIVSYSIVGFLFRVIYSGVLTAALIAPSYEKPIDSLEDLVRAKDVSLVLRRQTNVPVMLQSATTGIYVEVYEKLKKSPISYVDTPDQLKYLIVEKNFATIGARLEIEIRSPKGIHLSRESFYPQQYGMALNRGSNLLEVFNELLAALIQAGLIEKWKDEQVSIVRAMLSQTSESGGQKHEEDIPMKLKLIHLQGAFFLYICGIVLSIIIFSVELCFKKFHYK